MHTAAQISDEELLRSEDPEAFGVFYDRHVRTLLGYFARRVHDPEVAADLTAETFASAIVAKRRFKPGGAPPAAWLYTIAGRRLADYRRHGQVEQRMRRSLEMERRPVSAEDGAMIRLLADDATGTLLADLPADQRDAVVAHVVEDRAYPDLADEMHVSEATVRQRVSRGLAAMRHRIGVGG